MTKNEIVTLFISLVQCLHFTITINIFCFCLHFTLGMFTPEIGGIILELYTRLKQLARRITS